MNQVFYLSVLVLVAIIDIGCMKYVKFDPVFSRFMAWVLVYIVIFIVLVTNHLLGIL